MVEDRSYELHDEQAAAELGTAAELYGKGFWWTIGDEKRSVSCARGRRINWRG